MKTYTEIKADIWNLMDELDKVAPEWAEAKAKYEHDKEMAKIKIAHAKEAIEGRVSNAEKEDKARAGKEYQEFIDKSHQNAVDYYKKDAQKKKAELKIDALRTLLSFEKEFIPKTR